MSLIVLLVQQEQREVIPHHYKFKCRRVILVANEQTQNPVSTFWRRLWGAEQKVACDPGRAMELEEEVRRLTHVIDDMQGRNRAPGWRIMLDSESPISVDIMSAVIRGTFVSPTSNMLGEPTRWCT